MQEDKKKEKHRHISPLPTSADLNPLDEEVSKYIKNIAQQMALERKDVFADLDADDDYVDAVAAGDDSVDPGMTEKLNALKDEKKNATEDKENISKGLEAMQDKLMEMEESKLGMDCKTTIKKVFKIVVVGDANVGKTSLIYRYVNQKKPSAISATLGCEYTAKRVERPEKDTTVLLQIFDIQGLERYRKQAPRAFFKGAHGAVVVFDCHKDAAESFYGAQEWKKTIDTRFEENKRLGAPCILVANKSDFVNEEKFAFVRSPAKMERCCRDNNFISWHQTSSFDGRGLKEVQDREQPTCFDSLVDQLLLWDEQGKFATESAEREGAVDLEAEGAQPAPLCSC
jgi:small GTP-binding protein